MKLRKFSLFMAIILVCTCLSPLAIVAEGEEPSESPSPSPTVTQGNLLQMDKEIALNDLDPANYAGEGSYANAYMPKSKKTDNSYKINIPLPLKGLEKVTGKVSVTVSSEGLMPTNKTVIKPSTNDMKSADGMTMLFDFRDLSIASGAYNGTYAAEFIATYSQMIDGQPEEMTQTFTVFFAVQDKAAPSDGGGGGGSTGNAPRVMVTKYTTDVEEIKAGGTFSLTVDITNQSKSKKARNIKVTLSNEAGVFLPVDGTNAAYMDSIAAGKTVTKTFQFSVAPDAEPKPAMFMVEIAYEDTSGAALTENAVISLPITQPIRIQIDPPMSYETIEGEPIYVSMNIYNLGKSPIYNLMATVKGTGLSAEQAYFGGTIEAGGTKTVELAVLAETDIVGGDDAMDPLPEDLTKEDEAMPKDAQAETKTQPLAAIAQTDVAIMPGYMDPTYGSSSGGNSKVNGIIVLTYENAAGKQFQEEIDFTATVISYVDPGFNPDPVPEKPQGNLLWLWIALGVLVVAGTIIFIVLRKRKKNRMIEDALL